MAISGLNEQVRRIVLSGVIKEETAAHFLEQLTHLQYRDVNKPITLYIDTLGGNVYSGLLMYDAMMLCTCPIHTIGIGKVMSMGSLILAAGDPGNRYVTPNTSVMVHQVSGGTSGTISEMDIAVEQARKLQETYIEVLSKHTGVPKKKLVSDIHADNYMNASEAVKYGLADKVLQPKKKKLTQNSKIKSKRKSK